MPEAPQCTRTWENTGVFRRTGSLPGERRSWYFPALLEAEALSPSCPGQPRHSAGTTLNLQKNWCYPGLHFICVTSCPALRHCFTLQVMQFCLAFHTSSTDRLKTSFHDIIQNLGFRQGPLCQTPTTQGGPSQKRWSPQFSF